jgi:hypothetical protein
MKLSSGRSGVRSLVDVMLWTVGANVTVEMSAGLRRQWYSELRRCIVYHEHGDCKFLRTRLHFVATQMTTMDVFIYVTTSTPVTHYCVFCVVLFIGGLSSV